MQPEEIAKVIADKEHCGCEFIESVAVVEKFKGKTVWDGIVHVFKLINHAMKRCYAWVDGSTDRLVTVLEKPPVKSPETAVRAYIASTSKEN